MIAGETTEETAARLNRELEQKIVEKTASLRSANQDLQANNTLLAKVTNYTPNGLYIYDLEQKCNVYNNRFIGEILGYSAIEMEKINVQLFGKFLHSEDRDLVAHHHQQCLSLKDDEYLELEYRLQDSSGNWHWLHSKDTVFERNSTGKPTRILGIAQDITGAKKNQLKSAQLNAELAEKVETLEKWHGERVKLARMNEFLQACLTIHEAKSVLTDLLQPLFPNTHGIVYLMNNNNNLLDAIATWGIAKSESNFEPDECWSLRRGNLHQANSISSGLYCNHIDNNCNSSTLCLPMIAKGETLGMLHLRFDEATPRRRKTQGNAPHVNSHEAIDILVQELAKTVAQNIAMSFANLKLQEELRHQSLRDPLTGLYNRRYLQESLNKEIDRARRKQQSISLMMLDIDYFKRFNDVHGHSAGRFSVRRSISLSFISNSSV